MQKKRIFFAFRYGQVYTGEQEDVRLVKNDTRKIEKGDDGTGRRILILPGSTVIPRLKSLRSGDDPVFSFGVLFYALKRNPRRVVQHVDDAAPFKSVFLDQMLHDLIVRMRIDAQVRDLCPAVIDDLGEKSVDCSV